MFQFADRNMKGFKKRGGGGVGLRKQFDERLRWKQQYSGQEHVKNKQVDCQ